MEPLEKDFITRLKSGERSAFIELYKKYRVRLLYFLFKYIGNYEIAKDISHETILRAVDRIDTYEHDKGFSTWIFRIAINLANDEFRKRKNKIRVSLDPILKANEEYAGAIHTLSSEKPSPGEIAEKREVEEELHNIINSLPFIYKEVLVLFELEGYSYKEIAAIMNCSVTNVSARLARARTMLAEKIKKRAPHLIPKIKKAKRKRQ